MEQTSLRANIKIVLYIILQDKKFCKLTTKPNLIYTI